MSEGKYADIIAVQGDVLRYIDLFQSVESWSNTAAGGSD